MQVEEAVRLHKIPQERVVPVGAHSFDHWFGWEPSPNRKEFAKRMRLDPKRPLVLYLGSSYFISGDETPFVREWLQRVREHPRLCKMRRSSCARIRRTSSAGTCSTWTSPARRSSGLARRGSHERAAEGGLLRHALPLERDGRDQHDRADRGLHPAPSRFHPRQRALPDPGRDAAFLVHRRRERRRPRHRRPLAGTNISTRSPTRSRSPRRTRREARDFCRASSGRAGSTSRPRPRPPPWSNRLQVTEVKPERPPRMLRGLLIAGTPVLWVAIPLFHPKQTARATTKASGSS